MAAPFAARALGRARFLPFVLASVLVVAPWAWHTFNVTGSPAFNLSSYLLIAYTHAHPGLSPLWAAGAVRGADAIALNAARTRWLRAALLVALLPFWGWALARETRQSAALHRWLADERSALDSRGAWSQPGRLLFSDTPDFAAWTTGRSTIATTREAYRALPGSPGVVTSLPRAGEPRDEWFHADVRAWPAPARGGPAETTAVAR